MESGHLLSRDSVKFEELVQPSSTKSMASSSTTRDSC